MFTNRDRVVRVRDEYRSGTGKVLTAGDEVAVRGRKGRFRFRESLTRESGKVDLILTGMSRPMTGKCAYARPEDTTRKRKAELPKGATTAEQRWGDLDAPTEVDVVADVEGEAQEPAGPPEGHERLHCQECGRAWDREVVRGRKPVRCPDCAAR